MKKLQMMGLAAVLMLAACKNNGITISGTVERDIDSLSISVMLNDNGDTLIAKVPVVDGTYSWAGQVDSACIMRVHYGEGARDFYRVICEPGNITLNIPKEGEDELYPSGTPLNDSIIAYFNAVAEINKRYDSYFERIEKAQSDEERDSLREEQFKIWREVEQCQAGFLSRHTNDMFGIYLLREFQFFAQPDFIEEATQQLKANFPDNFWATFIAKHTEGQMRAFPGRQYTDLKMATPDGGELSLSDIIPNNRYTFVDFWASWCGPCCAELTNVKALYEKYHDKGLEVVGVSFDADAEAWKAAIAKYGITWPNMSDLKGWGCEAASVYGINGIPFTLLIGQDGIIIERWLVGEKLAKKLEELMGE